MADAPLRPALPWPDFVQELAAALGDKAEGVFLVGGAVRDMARGRPVHDLDLVVAGKGRRLARWIADQWQGDYYPLDDERDVGRALLVIDGARLIVDVARLRAASLGDDLRDRDFTLNAMAVHLGSDLNHIIDPLDGLVDLRAKRLRQCSPEALANDPIRALRAVRLSVQMTLRIEPDTLAAVRAAAPHLTRSSAERLRDEWFVMLGLPRASLAMRVARDLGLMTHTLPALAALPPEAWPRALAHMDAVQGLLQIISPRRTDETAAQFALGMAVMALDRYRQPMQAHLFTQGTTRRTHSALLQFAALVGPLGPNAAAQLALELRLSGDEQEWLARTLAAQSAFCARAEDTALSHHRYWRPAGAAGIDGVLLGLAGKLAAQGSQVDQDTWIGWLEHARALLEAWFDQRAAVVEPVPVLSGSDLMRSLRIKAGPLVGRLLDRLREAQVTGEVTTAEDALVFAARAYEESSRLA